MTTEEITRNHFHGFSDKQWKETKDTFPYSEIPHIIRDVLLQETIVKNAKEHFNKKEPIAQCCGNRGSAYSRNCKNYKFGSYK